MRKWVRNTAVAVTVVAAGMVPAAHRRTVAPAADAERRSGLAAMLECGRQSGIMESLVESAAPARPLRPPLEQVRDYSDSGAFSGPASIAYESYQRTNVVIKAGPHHDLVTAVLSYRHDAEDDWRLDKVAACFDD